MAGIDRDYWLDFAKDRVSKSVSSREDAAGKIDTFLSWLWTIYTTVFVLASLLDFLSGNWIQVILAALPIIVIMISRYYCTLVLMPTSKETAEVDPSIVPEIIDGFIIIVDEKKKRLNTAKIWAFISIVSLFIALVGYNIFDPNRKLKSDIKQDKLRKELNDQTPKPPTPLTPRQLVIDSIKTENDSLDYAYQNIIKKRKLDCLKMNNIKCIDSLKSLEK